MVLRDLHPKNFQYLNQAKSETGSSVQGPDSSVQIPASRVQSPESSVQSPASSCCVQSPGIPVCVQGPESRVQRPTVGVQSPGTPVYLFIMISTLNDNYKQGIIKTLYYKTSPIILASMEILNPLDTGRKLNVHKTFRRRQRHTLCPEGSCHNAIALRCCKKIL